MQKPGLIGMNGFIVVLLTVYSVIAQAQQPGNLILIDAENKQAFTVRLGDQLYSSSTHGHLVISQLKDSSYKLNLRFSKKNMAERVFHVDVKQKDLGFQLRGEDTTWVLYNWQTKQTIRSVYERDSSRILDQGVKSEDGFSRLMAAVVNDSSVMYNIYTGRSFNKDSLKTPHDTLSGKSVAFQTPNTTGRNPPVKTSVQPVVTTPAPVVKTTTLMPPVNTPVTKSNTSTVTASAVPNAGTSVPVNTLTVPPVKTGTAASSNLPSAAGSTALQTTAVTPRTTSSKIKKLREVSLKISRKIVFLDTGPDGVSDTVTLFVYFEEPEPSGNKTAKKEPVIPTDKTIKKDSIVPVSAAVKPANENKMLPGCGQMATESDQEYLRSAILKANAENEKIALASGAFGLKCFSVSQIRALAELFVSDKARYRLMEAAKSHLADPDHFRELADMYRDKNFQRKFLQMAEKRS